MLVGAMEVREDKKSLASCSRSRSSSVIARDGGFFRPAAGWVSNTPVEGFDVGTATPAFPWFSCTPHLIVIMGQWKISLLPPGPNRLP